MLIVWRPGSARSRWIWCLVRVHLLTGRGKLALLVGLFHKDANFNHEGPPSRPNHLPKTPPPNIITLGVRRKHVNLGRHKHSDHSTCPTPSSFQGCLFALERATLSFKQLRFVVSSESKPPFALEKERHCCLSSMAVHFTNILEKVTQNEGKPASHCKDGRITPIITFPLTLTLLPPPYKDCSVTRGPPK